MLANALGGSDANLSKCPFPLKLTSFATDTECFVERHCSILFLLSDSSGILICRFLYFGCDVVPVLLKSNIFFPSLCDTDVLSCIRNLLIDFLLFSVDELYGSLGICMVFVSPYLDVDSAL